jgi:GDP-4-dehydro-6-deoxy-D-mannose reductase
MQKILITGATGFVGSHLVEYLSTQSENILVGTFISENSIRNIQNKAAIMLSQVDLTVKEKVDSLIREQKPDVVYHLAALSSTAASFKLPSETLINNCVSQIHVLEAVKEYVPDAKVLIVASSDMYGAVPQDQLPLTEKSPFFPVTPYAVSKITQDYLGLQYHISYGLKIVRARPFNHVGPRQSPDFVVARFAKKIAEIEKGKHEPTLQVGNMESKRDFTDARDTVRAYALLVEKGRSGEAYNIGSGKSYKISEILDMLLSISKEKIKIEASEDLLRPADIPELRCDATKLMMETNWEPSIPIQKTLQDTLDYWRAIV